MTVPAVLVLGIVRLVRTNRSSAALLIAPLLGLALGIVHFTFNGTHMHKWYTFYAMPTVLLLIAIGLTAWRPRRRHPSLAALPVIGFIGLLLAVFWPQLVALQTTALSDPRGADQLTRSARQGYGNLEACDHITVGMFRRVVSYDPRKIQSFKGEHIRDAATLAKVLRHADAHGKTVDITVANIGFARATHANFFEFVDDGRYFEHLGTLPAVEPYIRIAIWRYRSGSFPVEAP